MDALMEDCNGMVIGMSVNILMSILFCILSTSLVSWSALNQVIFFITQIVIRDQKSVSNFIKFYSNTPRLFMFKYQNSIKFN